MNTLKDILIFEQPQPKKTLTDNQKNWIVKILNQNNIIFDINDIENFSLNKATYFLENLFILFTNKEQKNYKNKTNYNFYKKTNYNTQQPQQQPQQQDIFKNKEYVDQDLDTLDLVDNSQQQPQQHPTQQIDLQDIFKNKNNIVEKIENQQLQPQDLKINEIIEKIINIENKNFDNNEKILKIRNDYFSLPITGLKNFELTTDKKVDLKYIDLNGLNGYLYYLQDLEFNLKDLKKLQEPQFKDFENKEFLKAKNFTQNELEMLKEWKLLDLTFLKKHIKYYQNKLLECISMTAWIMTSNNKKDIEFSKKTINEIQRKILILKDLIPQKIKEKQEQQDLVKCKSCNDRFVVMGGKVNEKLFKTKYICEKCKDYKDYQKKYKTTEQYKNYEKISKKDNQQQPKKDFSIEQHLKSDSHKKYLNIKSMAQKKVNELETKTNNLNFLDKLHFLENSLLDLEKNVMDPKFKNDNDKRMFWIIQKDKVEFLIKKLKYKTPNEFKPTETDTLKTTNKNKNNPIFKSVFNENKKES